MIVKLFSKVPTVYQSQSIKSFGLPVQGLIDGSFYCEQQFQTKKKAIDFMINRASVLAENNKQLKSMIRDIKKSNFLSYDAATLHIIKVN